VICVEFLSEERSICIGLTNGDLINYNTITRSYELVGSFSNGLQSVSFSYDQELIVLLTQNNCLILMTKLFDVLTEKDLKTEDFGINKAVTVNWGSKSTQFHGEGKRDFRDNKQVFIHFINYSLILLSN
jgi:elongator complex protein 1